MSWWANWTQLIIAMDSDGNLVQHHDGGYRFGSHADVFYSCAKAEESASVLEQESGLPIRLLNILLPPDSKAAMVRDQLTRSGTRTLGWIVLDSDLQLINTIDNESTDVLLLESDIAAATKGFSSEVRVISITLPTKYLLAVEKKAEKLNAARNT